MTRASPGRSARRHQIPSERPAPGGRRKPDDLLPIEDVGLAEEVIADYYWRIGKWPMPVEQPSPDARRIGNMFATISKLIEEKLAKAQWGDMLSSGLLDAGMALDHFMNGSDFPELSRFLNGRRSGSFISGRTKLAAGVRYARQMAVGAVRAHTVVRQVSLTAARAEILPLAKKQGARITDAEQEKWQTGFIAEIFPNFIAQKLIGKAAGDPAVSLSIAVDTIVGLFAPPPPLQIQSPIQIL